jgi:uncharacterized membrane protein YgdD (TMEM256/DUF423 family)
MSDLLFTIGCCSMCSTLLLETYGYHGGMAYEDKLKWEVGVRFQQFGALPLLLSRGKKAQLPGWLAVAGTSMFCVPLYYSVLKEDKRFNKAMPIGGFFMMASWITLGVLV